LNQKEVFGRPNGGNKKKTKPADGKKNPFVFFVHNKAALSFLYAR